MTKCSEAPDTGICVAGPVQLGRFCIQMMGRWMKRCLSLFVQIHWKYV